jgi:GNAT superfamily N-acetyltransferase
MGDLRVHVADADARLRDRLQEEIYRFNVEATGLPDGRGMSLRVDGPSGELVAGLTGWTWGGTGYVEVLWVQPEFRGKGLGGGLLAAAEAEGEARGCTQMALSTHSFQAPDFYRRSGYLECGRFREYPAGHSQLHFMKALR